MPTQIPGYVSFKSFMDAVERCNRSNSNGSRSVVSCIDEAYGVSSASQMRSAFKFFGLYDQHTGLPSPTLAELANQGQRQGCLRRLLEHHYAPIWIDGLKLATSTWQELDSAMARHFNIHGSTIRNASRFLVSAALKAGMPVSDALQSRAPRVAIEPSSSEAPQVVGSGHNGMASGSSRQVSIGLVDRFHLIDALVAQLPATGSWSSHDRASWLQAFEGVLDLVIKVNPPVIQSAR